MNISPLISRPAVFQEPSTVILSLSSRHFLAQEASTASSAHAHSIYISMSLDVGEGLRRGVLEGQK